MLDTLLCYSASLYSHVVPYTDLADILPLHGESSAHFVSVICGVFINGHVSLLISGKASQREGESVGMSTVTTVAGGLLQVKTGDHVVIRTCEKNNPYAMCTDARSSKYRVYILQLTELEQQCARKAHACLRGRGCWYLNHHKHIASPLQAPILSDIWIRLDGYVVAAWGGDALSMLTAEQVAYINRHVLDGL